MGVRSPASLSPASTSQWLRRIALLMLPLLLLGVFWRRSRSTAGQNSLPANDQVVAGGERPAPLSPAATKPPTGQGPGRRFSAKEQAATRAYWTEERRRNATPGPLLTGS